MRGLKIWYMAFALLLFAGVILGGLAVVYSFRGKIFPMLYSALLTVFFMILIRELVRVAYLKPYFSVSDLIVVPQYSPLVLFLAFFIGGFFLVYWMFKRALKALENKEVQS